MKQAYRLWIKSIQLAALLCLATSATADGQAQDKAYLRNAYQKMDQAMGRSDPNGFVAFMSPDVVFTDKAGESTTRGKAGMKETMTGAFAGAAAGAMQMTQHTTLTHIRFTAQGATVDRTSDITFTTTAKGRRSAVKHGVTDRDMWVKSGGVWLLRTSRTIADY